MSLIGKKKLIFFFIFLTAFFLNAEELVKKYYNCIFAGGRERLYSLLNTKDQLDKLQINDLNITINMTADYSVIKLRYSVKNTGSDELNIKWAYPFLCSNFELETVNDGKKQIKNIRVRNDYGDYKMFVDNKEYSFQIEESDLRENLILYKTGSTGCVYLKNKEIEEKINSYFYTYAWYTADIRFNRKESRIIEIEYTVPHYYSVISLKDKSRFKITEDPSLQYVKHINNKDELYQSEKVFSFLFCTSYSKFERKIDNIDIKLTANVIDQAYMRIFPVNFERKDNKYYWRYKNLAAEEINNLLVKISPLYSEYTVNPFYIKTIPDINDNGITIGGNNNELQLYYDNKGGLISVKKIRIFTEAFTKRSEIRESNRPVEIEIEFSNQPDFSDAVKYHKKFSYKKYRKEISKFASITLYNDKGINCRYIKIKFLKLHEPDESLLISGIQIISD